MTLLMTRLGESTPPCRTPLSLLWHTPQARGVHGLTKAPDRNSIDSVLDRARRHGYCPLDLPTFDELCNIADDKLFGRAMRLPNHVLHALIPPQSTASQIYNLRHRGHSPQLPSHTTRLSDSNFITRMLYRLKTDIRHVTLELLLCILCLLCILGCVLSCR